MANGSKRPKIDLQRIVKSDEKGSRFTALFCYFFDKFVIDVKWHLRYFSVNLSNFLPFPIFGVIE